MNIKDTQTQKNLMTAFLREAGAYSEYLFYAEQAKTEGYEKIYEVFTRFANNEKAHSLIWFKLFHGIGGTEENLKDAAELERFERSTMYAEFSKTAKAEGLDNVAELFDAVAAIEKRHEEVYKTLFLKVKNDEMFSEPEEVVWECLNCGHIHVGKQPPKQCPVCSHPVSFFCIKPKNA